MQNLSKRFYTSIFLLIIIYISIISKLFLFLLLIVISYFVLTEIFKILNKVFKDNKKIVFVLYLIPLLYLSIFLPQLYFFIISEYNNQLIFLYLLSICIATDIGGYVFGKFFRGKKLTKISPNKTYSGLIGSYFFSIIVFIYFYNQFNFTIKFLILAFLISSISQLGDLFISYLKRKANMKDTSNLLPGHGGVLDRIDGIIFALPVGINLINIF